MTEFVLVPKDPLLELFEPLSEHMMKVLDKKVDGSFSWSSEESMALWKAALEGLASPTPPEAQGESVHPDTKRLDFIADDYIQVDSFAMPTPGGDDADVGWTFKQYHQGKTEPVLIHKHYSDNLREGIDQAQRALIPSIEQREG
jgi:hypothetical protein